MAGERTRACLSRPCRRCSATVSANSICASSTETTLVNADPRRTSGQVQIRGHDKTDSTFIFPIDFSSRERIMSTYIVMSNQLEQGAGSDIVLSENSVRVLELAQVEARSLMQHYIGTEHILLGLVTDETVGERFLGLGISSSHVHGLVESLSGYGRSPVTESGLPLSRRATAVIDQAKQLVILEGACDLTPFHLLKGIYRLDDGMGRGILYALSIREEQLLSPGAR